MSSNSNDQLLIGLEKAMPLWLDELRAAHPLERGNRAKAWAKEAQQEAATGRIARGPGGRTRGATARVFNLLSRGLAAISLQPGGVTVFGRTWCARHHPTGIARFPGERDSGCEYCVTGQRVYEGLPPRRDFVNTLLALRDAL
jgi:hypothetical protein